MSIMKYMYDRKDPIGIYSENAFCSILVMDVIFNFDEYMITTRSINGKRGKYTKNKVYCSDSGKYYIRKNGQRIYLNDIMRYDYPKITH